MKTKKIEFAVFILTHGRPENIHILKTLKNCGYTGPIYIVVDDEDKTAPKYKELYGDQVIMFCKKDMADMVDEGDNFDERRAIQHARNATYILAKELNVKFWIQLDDDYTAFAYRLYGKDKPNQPVKSLDKVFGYMLDFYKSVPAVTIAMSQGGDFIGGKHNPLAKRPLKKRKAMNS